MGECWLRWFSSSQASLYLLSSVCPSFSFILLAVCSVLVITSSTGTCLGAMANFRPKTRTCSCASVSCWLLRFTTSRLLSRVLICRCRLSCSRFSNFFFCVCFTFSCFLLPCPLDAFLEKCLHHSPSDATCGRRAYHVYYAQEFPFAISDRVRDSIRDL